jgi:hypothetical protein
MTISINSRQARRSAPSAAMLIFPANKNASGAIPLAAGAEGSLAYTRLIVSRCSQGLLEPFCCAVCGVMTLDPIGWNGARKPLCARCADPLAKGEE